QAGSTTIGSKTTNFWVNTPSPVMIHRWNDRIFVGGAVDNKGATTDHVDWLEVVRNVTTNNSQLAVLNTVGAIAVLGASRCSDGTAGSGGTIGLMGFANNDNAGSNGVWASYLEARTQSGVGASATTIGLEIDTYNAVASFSGSLQPYSMFPGKATIALWLASGAGFTPPTRSHVALGILDNGSTFDKGIVFKSTALERSGGGGSG